MFETSHHGLRFLTVTTALTAFRIAATSVIGLVATASDADAAVFPLNTAVALYDLPTAIAEAGEEGTLSRALKDINDLVRTVVVVVRVAESTNVNPATAQTETNTNVVAGLQKLLTAEQTVSVKPRILGCPGLDTPTVAAGLAVVLPKLGAFGYAKAAGDVAAAAAYRDTLSCRELMLIRGDHKVGAETSYAVARAMGLRAQIDQTQGFNKSISNVAIAGVTGLTDPVSWDLQSSSTEAGTLNAADVTVTIQRNGFRFWGNHTTSDDALWLFETAVRTDQVIRDTIADGVFPYLDRPLSPALVKTIVDSINAMFRDLKANGRILGAECFYDAENNTPTTLSAGKLRLRYKFTDTPPLEDLGIAVEKTSEYLVGFDV